MKERASVIEIRDYVRRVKGLSYKYQKAIEATTTYNGITSVPFKTKEEAFYLKSVAPPQDHSIDRMMAKDDALEEYIIDEKIIKRVERKLLNSNFTETEWTMLHWRFFENDILDEVARKTDYNAPAVYKIIAKALDKYEKENYSL